jgi:ABC-type transport system involved in multi-copper enzyme maturation permease subunit
VRQTLAIFLDSYRELNARKLFWITLILSGLVVLVFLGLGINERGLTVFGFVWPTPINTGLVDRAFFYKNLFLALGVSIWLTWVATILALISTGGIFPDLLTGGAIDLYLSKPIGRLRLFITKYFAGLLFVFLQVATFSVASFLVLGIRGGTWVPGVLLAVPVVLAFYSYLYCVSTILGVVTRSTVAAILLTILVWIGILAVHAVEVTLLKDQIKNRLVTERLDRQIAQRETELHTAEAMGPGTLRDARTTFHQKKLDDLHAKRRTAESDAAFYAKWHRGIYALATALPKTSETVELMKRWLISSAELRGINGDPDAPDLEDEPKPVMFGMTIEDLHAQQETDKVLRARPLSWVVGTSLCFEVAVVSLAAWIFCRRDY